MEHEHKGPILRQIQDGEPVFQCLACGETWNQYSEIMYEADSEDAHECYH